MLHAVRMWQLLSDCVVLSQVDNRRAASVSTSSLIQTMGELETQVDDAINQLTIMPMEMEHRCCIPALSPSVACCRRRLYRPHPHM